MTRRVILETLQNPLKKVNRTLIDKYQVGNNKNIYLILKELRIEKLKTPQKSSPLPPPPQPVGKYHLFHNLCFALCGKLEKKHDFYEKRILKKGGFISHDGFGANVIIIKDLEVKPKSKKYKIANNNSVIITEYFLNFLLKLQSKSPIILESYTKKLENQEITKTLSVTKETVNNYDWSDVSEEK